MGAYDDDTVPQIVDCRRPSFSGLCCPCMERTIMPRHVCTVPTSFLKSPEDSSV